MNKKNILGVAIAVITIILIYLILKSRKKSPTLANGQGENLTSDDFAGGGGNLGSSTQGVPENVGCNSNCCQEYSDDIDTENPISNLGTCGIAVYEWQQWLNGWAGSQGIPPITVDGAYGSNTLQQHQALIASQQLDIPSLTNA